MGEAATLAHGARRGPPGTPRRVPDGDDRLVPAPVVPELLITLDASIVFRFR
jgi:hypothetical protein